jgi:group II intron reverse transcriptase/maturase
MARTHRDRAFASLHHVLDLEWMLEAYRATRKDGAAGIDGATAADYAERLEDNLLDLLDRIKSGRYQAPPVRRSYIPKADGSQRPLGIPTFEDKVAQRAIVMLLEVIYEQDFLSCSYGFRPERSAHDALHDLRRALMTQGMRWVLDIDIKRYFDTIPHAQLRRFLDQRVTDGVVRRMIDKWLKAGVLENGSLSYSTEGTPQGGVISPLLANIYLHYVLDEWVATVVGQRLKGRYILVRYADDLVMAFEVLFDAQRVFRALGQRLNRFGLTLHPDKSRFIDFRFRRPVGQHHPATNVPRSIPWLHSPVEQVTEGQEVVHALQNGRFARALSAVTEWCQRNRHQSIRQQHAHLSAMLRGHYGYYGITGNGRRIRWYLHQVVRVWKKWLSRRGRHGNFRWDRLRDLLGRHPLPPARITRQYAVPSEALS